MAQDQEDQQSPSAFDKIASQVRSGGGLDPFMLQFLFAMGELSGQVAALTREVSNLSKARVAYEAAMGLKLDGQAQEIDSLKKWRYITSGGVAVLSALATIIGEYLVQHGL